MDEPFMINVIKTERFADRFAVELDLHLHGASGDLKEAVQGVISSVRLTGKPEFRVSHGDDVEWTIEFKVTGEEQTDYKLSSLDGRDVSESSEVTYEGIAELEFDPEVVISDSEAASHPDVMRMTLKVEKRLP